MSSTLRVFFQLCGIMLCSKIWLKFYFKNFKVMQTQFFPCSFKCLWVFSGPPTWPPLITSNFPTFSPHAAFAGWQPVHHRTHLPLSEQLGSRVCWDHYKSTKFSSRCVGHRICVPGKCISLCLGGRPTRRWATPMSMRSKGDLGGGGTAT